MGARILAFIATSGGVLALIFTLYVLFVWGMTQFVKEEDEE